MKEDIASTFGAPSENENRRRVVGLLLKGSCAREIVFQEKVYIRVH